MARRLAGLSVVLCVLASSLPIDELREDARRFVVTRGCPDTLDPSARIRLFVAVPSAAQNAARRQWARATWCQEARERPAAGASVQVKFFVGRDPGTGAPFPRIDSEAARYGDVVTVPSWDGQDNVTAKQVNTFRYFALLHGDAVSQDAFSPAPGRSPAPPTHYARVEDDVFAFLPTLTGELVAGRIRAFPGPDVDLDAGTPFAWAFFVRGAYAYPSGSGFLLSARLPRAVVAGDAVLPLDIGGPGPSGTCVDGADGCKPSWGKGGYRRHGGPGAWSTDDAHVGALLDPYAFARVDDRRFHDPLGSGLNSWPASRHSLAVAGLRTWDDFRLLGDRAFDAFNGARGVPGLAHAADGTSLLTMEVNGLRYDVPLAGCAGVEELTVEACALFALQAPMCETLGTHFRQACAAAEAHRTRGA